MYTFPLAGTFPLAVVDTVPLAVVDTVALAVDTVAVASMLAHTRTVDTLAPALGTLALALALELGTLAPGTSEARTHCLCLYLSGFFFAASALVVTRLPFSETDKYLLFNFLL